MVHDFSIMPCAIALISKNFLRGFGFSIHTTLNLNFVAVHDCQLVDDIPVEKLLIHDVPVDIICTPTQVIFTNTTIPKPQGS